VTENKLKQQVRRLYFDHYKVYRGKDRYNALGRFKDNLTVPEMMRLIKTHQDGAPAKKTTVRRRVARTA
jgi:hypothetical protein